MVLRRVWHCAHCLSHREHLIWFPTRYILAAEILVLAGTAGTGRKAPPTSTRIPARLESVQEYSSPGSVCVLQRRASVRSRGATLGKEDSK